jgi:hypothetical protein
LGSWLNAAITAADRFRAYAKETFLANSEMKLRLVLDLM